MFSLVNYYSELDSCSELTDTYYSFYLFYDFKPRDFGTTQQWLGITMLPALPSALLASCGLI